MTNLFRKYQQPMMLVVTVIIIVAFVWLYNGTQLDKIGVDKAYRIYDRTLSQADIERNARRFYLAQALGLNELLEGLAGRAFTQDQAVENFVWNSFVLTREADALGIEPSSDEIVNRIRLLPGFQTHGQFDPIKYQEFVQNMLMPNGFTDAQLEELVRDDLRLRKMVSLVGGTADLSPGEFNALYQETLALQHASLIAFRLNEFSEAAEVSEEEIKNYFEQHGKNLTTDERRVTSFIVAGLSDEEKALPERERVAALQKLANRVSDFTQALLKEGANFAEVAKESGFEVKTTPPFRLGAPAEEIASIPQVAQTVFGLTEKAPFSEAITHENQYYVFHLDKVIEKEPLTLEEARPRIVEAIRREKGQNLMVTKANEARAKLAEALKAGQSLEAAATAAGVKVEKLAPFSLREPIPGQSAMQEIANATLDLAPGALSHYVPSSDGGLLIYLEKRDPVDPAKLEEIRKSELPELRQFRQRIAFGEWLVSRLKAANPHSLHPRGDAPQQEGNAS